MSDGGGGHPDRVLRFTLLALLAVALVVGLRTLPGEPPPPEPVDNRAFRLGGAGQRPVTIWAVGDGADGEQAGRRLAAMIERRRPARLLYLGDVYEDGTREEFTRNYASVYGDLARRTAPTPGNHEWGRHPDGYDDYWEDVTGHPTPPWYDFRLAGWHILSLNSEAPHGEDSEQVRWLRRRVAGSGDCRLAFWHRPLMSAGKHGDSEDTLPLWAPLRGRARIVLGGHDHNMQRFRPRDGITQYVSGAGGRGRYAVREDDPRLAFGNDDAHGALRIALRPGRADLAFVRADGRVLDRSTVRCQAG